MRENLVRQFPQLWVLFLYGGIVKKIWEKRTWVIFCPLTLHLRKYISIFCLSSYFYEAKKPTRITTHCYSCKCNFSLSDLRTDNKGARVPHHKVILGKCGVQWIRTIDSQMWSSALKIDKNMRFVGNPFNGFHAITSSWLVWFPIVFSGFLSLLQSLCHGSWNLKHVLWHVPILYIYTYIYAETRGQMHIFVVA